MAAGVYLSEAPNLPRFLFGVVKIQIPIQIQNLLALPPETKT